MVKGRVLVLEALDVRTIWSQLENSQHFVAVCFLVVSPFRSSDTPAFRFCKILGDNRSGSSIAAKWPFTVGRFSLLLRAQRDRAAVEARFKEERMSLRQKYEDGEDNEKGSQVCKHFCRSTSSSSTLATVQTCTTVYFCPRLNVLPRRSLVMAASCTLECCSRCVFPPDVLTIRVRVAGSFSRRGHCTRAEI